MPNLTVLLADLQAKLRNNKYFCNSHVNQCLTDEMADYLLDEEAHDFNIYRVLSTYPRPRLCHSL
jgi:hypothetical protein